MKKLMFVVAALVAVPCVMAEDAVTLESLHREMLELKAEIQGLRQEIREGGRFKSLRTKGTNDVDLVRSDKRPPKDPEARKAWFAERRKAYEAKIQALRAKHAAKDAAAKPAEGAVKAADSK